MFDRFTDRSRKVMSFARRESERFNHDYIGTEHILLGLIKEGSGVAAHALNNLNVKLEKVRQEVEKLVKAAPDVVTMGQLPFTPRAKRVLELAIDEARAMDHNYVGTEHLLLGLIREREGLAAAVLTTLGLKEEDVRQKVMEFLGAHPDRLKRMGLDGTPRPAPESPRTLAIALRAEPALLTALGDAQGLANEFKDDTTRAEHLLLGLLQDDKGFAAQVLAHFGLKVDDVRNEIVRRIKAR
jgi:ATP-dependent Clp protease ATP-binding subunit ClpA